MLKTIKLEKASRAKASEYNVFRAIKVMPAAIIPKPMTNMTIEPTKATIFIVIFLSKARSTSMQESFLKFLMLTTRSKIQTIIPRAQPTGAKTN